MSKSKKFDEVLKIRKVWWARFFELVPPQPDLTRLPLRFWIPGPTKIGLERDSLIVAPL